jgi:hypothetical protein
LNIGTAQGPQKRRHRLSRKIVNTNIRLNLEREDDHRAWEYLQRIGQEAIQVV